MLCLLGIPGRTEGLSCKPCNRRLLGMPLRASTFEYVIVRKAGVFFLPKWLWSLIRLTSFTNTCFSTCLGMSSIVQLVSDLCVHTLRFETATWSQSSSPTCDLCGADDVQDEQHVLFHCANPHVISLRRKYAPLFPPTGAHDVFTFLSQNNNKLYNCIL